MSYQTHMGGYNDPRTLYQTDRLYALKHNLYFPPALVEISPTNICNQHCRFCYTDAREKRKTSLGNDVLISAFEQVADVGAKGVLIQGSGEPLMHSALPDAIEVGAKNQLAIGLVTNAVLLIKPIQKRILKNLFFVKFSVLDNNPKRYAYLHGCSEKQHKTLIDNIKSAIALRDKHNLQVALWGSVYLFKDNFHDVYNIVKFCKDLGLDYIVVQEATYTEYSPSNKEEYASYTVSDVEINKMKSKLLTLNDDTFQVKVRFPINDKTYFVGMAKECWKTDYCQGIKFFPTIATSGEVYPCARAWGDNVYSYGNIYDKTFENIWKGEKRKRIEKIIMGIPPFGDECAVCNHGKLNEILYQYQHEATKWKEFLGC
jgi:radical SAM protein with 4Fe4S-binding SPASM domain